MKIKMIKTAADANATYVAGAVVDLEDKEARILIEAGAAEAVSDTKSKGKKQKTPVVETADALGSAESKLEAAQKEQDAEGK